MTRYADPLACPDCRGAIEPMQLACPHCQLPLRGSTAQALFSTLQRADELVAALRSHPVAAQPAQQTHWVTVEPPPGASVYPRSYVSAYPATPRDPEPRRSALEAASIPKILLGLGATCLLVAALVFLAVAWSSMGMGGRTAVLLTLTALSGALMAWVAKRDLRAGAEAFATVMLGLIALDVIGADNAGWLDTGSTGWFGVILGGTVAAAGFGVALFGQRTPVRRLVAGEVIAGLGLAVAGFGLLDAVDDSAGTLVATIVTLAAAALAHRVRMVQLALGLLVLAGLWWLGLVGNGASAVLAEPTAARIWGDFEAWPLLAATALIAAPALVRRLEPLVRATFAAAALVVGTALATVVAVGNPLDDVALTAAGVLTLSALLIQRLPAPWTWTPMGVLVPAAVATFFLALLQSGLVASRYGMEPWTASAGDGLGTGDLPLEPWLLLPLVGALVVAFVVAARRIEAHLPWPTISIVLTSLTAAALVASYDVPLWVPFGIVLAGLVATWLTEFTGDLPSYASTGLAVVLLLAALPSDWLTLLALATLTVIAIAADRLDDDALLAQLVQLPLAAATIGTAAWIADWQATWTVVGILVFVGIVAILLPRPITEIGAAATGVATVIAQAPDLTWFAVDLTVAGALVTVSALVHRRTELGYAGAALLMGATWVRLLDTGVTTPEAYTLPLAAVLLGFGLFRMWRSDTGSLTALTPGLGLAVVPSLLIVLGEPVGTRALLLGAGCLVLVLAGVALRWSGPLLVGAGAGLVEVLREASYASVIPQWVLIALVGSLLTVIGVTWEQRVRDLRLATGYVRGLR